MQAPGATRHFVHTDVSPSPSRNAWWQPAKPNPCDGIHRDLIAQLAEGVTLPDDMSAPEAMRQHHRRIDPRSSKYQMLVSIYGAHAHPYQTGYWDGYERRKQRSREYAGDHRMAPHFTDRQIYDAGYRFGVEYRDEQDGGYQFQAGDSVLVLQEKNGRVIEEGVATVVSRVENFPNRYLVRFSKEPETTYERFTVTPGGAS